eukprot:tig00021591_g22796.t1
MLNTLVLESTAQVRLTIGRGLRGAAALVSGVAASAALLARVELEVRAGGGSGAEARALDAAWDRYCEAREAAAAAASGGEESTSISELEESDASDEGEGTEDDFDEDDDEEDDDEEGLDLSLADSFELEGSQGSQA